MYKVDCLYYRSAKERILTALYGNQCTFEELCKMGQGLYPTLIKDILEELCIYNSLVPIYTTQQECLPYNVQDESYYEEREIVTASIQNNPILSSWYFSWNTCSKIGQLDVWKKKKLLFLGTPRLFEYFASRHYGDSLTLIDLDSTVINALSAKYKSSLNTIFLSADIGNMDEVTSKLLLTKSYDFVFFDPPWYPDDYSIWMNTALKYVKPDGSIVFSLFPALLRPTAIEERKTILDRCREIAKNTYLCSGHLEYDIPTFEKNELEMEGIKLRSNWKTSDMIVVSGVFEDDNYKFSKCENRYVSWKEFWWLDTRWFLDTSRTLENDNHLLSAPLKTLYLKSPSRRNIQLKEVNLLSSKGHGLRVSNPPLFLAIVKQLNEKSKDFDYSTIVNDLEIDDESKAILQQLVREL